ncbi:lytic transglycosylase, partial [Streptomyces sp. SID2888]|nr:lytic transglycosylase [Streptomyces sp. SID2888]
MPAFSLPARRRNRNSKAVRLTRALAVAGTGAAVLALPILGATGASAATPAKAPMALTASTSTSGNLDGWIRQSLSIMKQHGIPGSYNGIYRNV